MISVYYQDMKKDRDDLELLEEHLAINEDFEKLAKEIEDLKLNIVTLEKDISQEANLNRIIDLTLLLKCCNQIDPRIYNAIVPTLKDAELEHLLLRFVDNNSIEPTKDYYRQRDICRENNIKFYNYNYEEQSQHLSYIITIIKRIKPNFRINIEILTELLYQKIKQTQENPSEGTHSLNNFLKDSYGALVTLSNKEENLPISFQHKTKVIKKHNKVSKTIVDFFVYGVGLPVLYMMKGSSEDLGLWVFVLIFMIGVTMLSSLNDGLKIAKRKSVKYLDVVRNNENNKKKRK